MLGLGPTASLELLRREGLKIGHDWRLPAHRLAKLLARSPSEMASLLADLQGVSEPHDLALGARTENVVDGDGVPAAVGSRRVGPADSDGEDQLADRQGEER